MVSNGIHPPILTTKLILLKSMLSTACWQAILTKQLKYLIITSRLKLLEQLELLTWLKDSTKILFKIDMNQHKTIKTISSSILQTWVLNNLIY